MRFDRFGFRGAGPAGFGISDHHKRRFEIGEHDDERSALQVIAQEGGRALPDFA